MSERTTPLVKNAGVDVGRGRTIDFIAGANIELTITETPSEEINVTIGSAGGAGAGVDVEEDNAVVGTATILDFGAGFDVGFAAGEADITIDTSEITVLTGLAFAGNVE